MLTAFQTGWVTYISLLLSILAETLSVCSQEAQYLMWLKCSCYNMAIFSRQASILVRQLCMQGLFHSDWYIWLGRRIWLQGIDIDRAFPKFNKRKILPPFKSPSKRTAFLHYNLHFHHAESCDLWVSMTERLRKISVSLSTVYDLAGFAMSTVLQY